METHFPCDPCNLSNLFYSSLCKRTLRVFCLGLRLSMLHKIELHRLLPPLLKPSLHPILPEIHSDSSLSIMLSICFLSSGNRFLITSHTISQFTPKQKWMILS